jgi:hypothetical protein
LTERTNFVVVHERADGVKANDLPSLKQIRQMLAAGWGGAGKVCGLAHLSCRQALEVDLNVAAYDSCSTLAAAKSARELAYVPPTELSLFLKDLAESRRSEKRQPSIDKFLHALDETFMQGRRSELPSKLDELTTLGVPDNVLALLRTLIKEGQDEALVVRVFLATLDEHAQTLGLSRHLLRAFRRSMLAPSEHLEVRERVAALVSVVLAVEASWI